MKTNQLVQHVREHRSILAAGEKRLLVWLAGKLPSWVSSDQLSLLGLGSMIMAGLAYWAARWNEQALFLVVVALALNWFGDSLDGTLARVRNQQRPCYGFYVDHLIDLVGVLALIGGLAASDYMAPLVALGLLVGYLMVSAELFLATHTVGIFRLSSFWVGGTELRILLATGTLLLLEKPLVEVGHLGTLRLFDVAGVSTIAALGVSLVLSVARNVRTLSLAEPPIRTPGLILGRNS